MGLWADRVLPPLFDRSLSTPKVTALRREAFADARGRLLEIGFGSGLSLQAFPDAVTEIVALDPSAGMRARAEPRIEASGRTVRYVAGGGESLPFEDESFDTVASAFTMCSIDGVEQALAEVRRVLKPDGAFLFLEHGLAPEPGVQRIQRVLSPINWFLAGGCQLIKDHPANVRAAGLHIERQRAFYFEESPRVMGWFTIGLARRTSPPAA